MYLFRIIRKLLFLEKPIGKTNLFNLEVIYSLCNTKKRQLSFILYFKSKIIFIQMTSIELSDRSELGNTSFV